MREREGQRREQVYVVVGGLLMLGAAALTFLGVHDETLGYAVGAVLGRIFLAVVIALVGRFAYLRLTKTEGDPAAQPQVMLAGGIIALVLSFTALSQQAQESEDTFNQVTESIQQGAASCSDPLPGKLGEVRVDPVKGRLEQQLRALAARQSLFPELVDVTVYRRAVWPDGGFAIITLMPFDEADDATFQQDVVSGATDRLEEGGASVEAIDVSGRPAAAYELPDVEFGVVTTLECYVMTVSALEQGRAEELARLAVDGAL